MSAWLMHTHLCSYVWINCRHQFNSCHDLTLTWHPLTLVVTQDDLALVTFVPGYEVIQTWQGRPQPSYQNLNNLIKPPHNHSAYLVAQSHYMTCSQFLSGRSPAESSSRHNAQAPWNAIINLPNPIKSSYLHISSYLLIIKRGQTISLNCLHV